MPGVERIFTATDVPGQRGTGLRFPICRFLWRSAKPRVASAIFSRWWWPIRLSMRARPRTRSESTMKCYEPVTDPFEAHVARIRRRCMRPAICTCIRICSTPRHFRAAMWMLRWRLRRTSSSRPSARSPSNRRFWSRRLAWQCRREKASRSFRRARVRRSIKRRSRDR